MANLSNLFDEVLVHLVRANVARDNGADRLEVALNCLANVIRLLEYDVRVREAALAGPLRELANALQDLLKGANPPLLANRSNGQCGAPTGTTFDGVRGVCAAAVSILTHGGESRRAAGAFVASELRRLGVRDRNKKPISANRILHWKNEIHGTASQLTTNMHNAVVARIDWASFDSADKTRALVTEILTGLQTAGF